VGPSIRGRTAEEMLLFVSLSGPWCFKNLTDSSTPEALGSIHSTHKKNKRVVCSVTSSSTKDFADVAKDLRWESIQVALMVTSILRRRQHEINPEK
jgi:hypothetical protein